MLKLSRPFLQVFCALTLSCCSDPATTKNAEGRTLQELVALTVGRLGENIALKKAEHYVAPEGFELYFSSHPKGSFMMF